MTQTQLAIRNVSLEYPRLIGVFLLALSAVLFYLCIYEPIQQAQSGAESVTINIKGTIVAIMVGLLAPGYLVLGSRFVEMIWPLPGQPKAMAYGIAIGLGLLGLAAFVGLKNHLQAMGYSF